MGHRVPVASFAPKRQKIPFVQKSYSKAGSPIGVSGASPLPVWYDYTLINTQIEESVDYGRSSTIVAPNSAILLFAVFQDHLIVPTLKPRGCADGLHAIVCSHSRNIYKRCVHSDKMG